MELMEAGQVWIVEEDSASRPSRACMVLAPGSFANSNDVLDGFWSRPDSVR
jgi:hypothetical protein